MVGGNRVLKAYFDEAYPLTEPKALDDDARSLDDYKGSERRFRTQRRRSLLALGFDAGVIGSGTGLN